MSRDGRDIIMRTSTAAATSVFTFNLYCSNVNVFSAGPWLAQQRSSGLMWYHLFSSLIVISAVSVFQDLTNIPLENNEDQTRE